MSRNGEVRRDGRPISYYGRPILKPPPWRAYIPLYLFTGGLAGASAPLVLAARATRNDALARAATLGAAFGIGTSPVLLIADLRDPKRFHHMLRLFKITSPMSVGSWLLTALGGATGAAAASELIGVARGAGRFAEVIAALVGPGVATYTAALVADTAVPSWHDAHRELPFVFAGGALASAAGFALLATPVEDAVLARRVVVAGTALELAGLEALKRRLGPLLAEPYDSGTAGVFSRVSRAASVAALACALPARTSRTAAAACGLFALAGALAERFAVFEAGKQSARDPKYTVLPQRELATRATSAPP